MDQTTAAPESITLLNAPQFNMPLKIVADDIKAHATIKARANRSIDTLMSDIYQSTSDRRADLSKSALDALDERIKEYRIITEAVQNLESFIATWNSKPHSSMPFSDFDRVTRDVTLKMLGLLTSPHVSHEIRMACLVKYPAPINIGASFESTISAYGKAMEPYWVEIEMLVQKYHVSVDNTVSDTKPWWKFW